jgi:hypothetical protein
MRSATSFCDHCRAVRCAFSFAFGSPDRRVVIADRVSAESPLGHALLGRRAGEQVRFRAPGGVLAVTVVEVNVR